MKKTILLITLAAITCSLGLSQSLEQNLKKYWYYRDRLKSDFMVVDNNNGQGTNIPASLRNKKEDAQGVMQTYLEWGDAEAYLGQYVMVLATEYKLLKDNEQDYSETLQELKNALNAFERLDKYAEYWWRDPHSSTLPDDINGFFIRDDVGEVEQSPNCILNHPNSQLAQSGITEIESDFINANDGGHPCEMSKDQVWQMLSGLALVETLVDEPGYIIQDALGANVTFREWTRKITHRVITYMHGAQYQENWWIINPITLDPVRRGAEVSEDFGITLYGASSNGFSYGFAEAGDFITKLQGYTSLHYGSSNSNDMEDDFHIVASLTGCNLSWWLQWLNIDPPAKSYSYQTLMTIIGNENVVTAPIPCWGYPYQSYNYFDWLRAMYYCTEWYEQFFLLYGIFHGFPVNSNTNMPFVTYSDHLWKEIYSGLLDLAPDCGPYNFDEIENENWPDVDWSSTNRLIWPERLGNSNEDPGYYNGLDYMLLHNLFCLVYENFIENIESGNTESLIQSTDIISSDVVEASEVVEYIADRKVILKPGFQAESSAYFYAGINPQNDNLNYRKTVWTPQCSYIFPIGNKSVSLLDTLNKNVASFSVGINIYPNPGQGKYVIESNNPVEVINSVEIVNTLSQKVYSGQAILKGKLQIDISKEPTGIYFVKIISGNQIFNKQIIIQ